MRSKILCLIMLCVLVSACGFKPLYAGFGQQSEVLDTVWIDRISGLRGQTFRNHLIDRFYHSGYPDAARYNLRIRLESFNRNLDLEKDDTASRAQLIIRASYDLIDRRNNKIVHNAVVRSVNSYNILDSQFTTIVTREDAEDRALRDLADKIQTRITLFLTEEVDT